MRLSPPFDPLQVGEVDNFCFNFTTRVGDAHIVFSRWTLELAADQPGTDPDPQIVELANPSQLDVKLPNSNIQTLYGNFAVAQVGPCPSSAAGCTYIIDCQVTLSDGRILADNNTFRCVLPGEF